MPGQNEVLVQDIIQEHDELAQVRATVHGGASFMRLDLNNPPAHDRIQRDLFRDHIDAAVINPPDWHQILRDPQDPQVPQGPAPELPEMLGPWNTGPIVFDDGVALGGWAEVTLHRDGRFEFRGHLHDSGAASYNTSVVVVVRAGDGHIYTFTHTGVAHGTFGAGSRDDDWDNAGQNDELAANWAGLVSNWAWHWSAAANTDWQALLDSALKAAEDALKVAGVVIAVVALV
jgi:hypothetical protein